MDTLERIQREASLMGCTCLVQEPMSKHTTFRIGGPADLLVTAGTMGQLRGLVRLCRETETPVYLLGRAPTCWCRMKASGAW